MVFYDPRNEVGTLASHEDGKGVSSFDVNWGGGLGLEYFPNEFWSITLMGEYVMTGSAYYAGSGAYTVGNLPFNVNPSIDSYARLSLQFRYYFFDQGFITKLLQAQRDRLKHK